MSVLNTQPFGATTQDVLSAIGMGNQARADAAQVNVQAGSTIAGLGANMAQTGAQIKAAKIQADAQKYAANMGLVGQGMAMVGDAVSLGIGAGLKTKEMGLEAAIAEGRNKTAIKVAETGRPTAEAPLMHDFIRSVTEQQTQELLSSYSGIRW